MARRPFKHLRVVGKRHRVLWDQTLEDRYADFTALKLQIRVTEGLEPDDEREALLHEVVHAVDVQMNLNLPEEIVRQLSVGLFAVLRDNPKFAAYLMEEGGDE